MEQTEENTHDYSDINTTVFIFQEREVLEEVVHDAGYSIHSDGGILSSILVEEISDNVDTEELFSSLIQEVKDSNTREYTPELSAVDASSIEPAIEAQPLLTNSTESPSIAGNARSSELQQSPRRKRSRKSTPALWKKNKKMALVVAGMSYRNAAEKHVTVKTFRRKECHCKFKCAEEISHEHQEALFKEYYTQCSYLASLIDNAYIKQHKVVEPKIIRTQTASYCLKNSSSERVCVCRDFFCNTFAISHKMTHNILQKKSPTSAQYNPQHKNKGRTPPNIISSACINKVKTFINSIPKVPSHYCWKRSHKLYFEASLNISKLHKLYCEWLGENYPDEIPVRYSVLTRVIKEWELQLGFYKPKKDQCSVCNYARSTGIEDDAYKDHIACKDAIAKQKEEDKASCMNSSTSLFATFNIQALLTLPYTEDGCLYYSRKLSVINFTIFAHNHDGVCFTWDESQGSKGSCEVSTCLIHYLKSLPKQIEHVVFYCDTCSGQNRNQNLTAAMVYDVNDPELDNIKTIDIKHFESGYSMMECDSMHSLIEHVWEHHKIFSPNEYALLFGLARSKPCPYVVHQMTYTDFIDFGHLAKTFMYNCQNDENRATVQWLKIKFFRYSRGSPAHFFFKYSVDEPQFTSVHLSTKQAALACGRHRGWNSKVAPIMHTIPYSLQCKYMMQKPISIAKKRDLIKLLHKKIIPLEYSSFYENLKADKSIIDYMVYDCSNNEDDDGL